ncbi:MAG: hypothetical protein ACREXU_13125, partial [Gammaproteobacteria bacterium]
PASETHERRLRPCLFGARFGFSVGFGLLAGELFIYFAPAGMFALTYAVCAASMTVILWFQLGLPTHGEVAARALDGRRCVGSAHSDFKRPFL